MKISSSYAPMKPLDTWCRRSFNTSRISFVFSGQLGISVQVVFVDIQVDATQRMMIEDLPPVLVLHLKWFIYDKNGGIQKCIKQVDFDVDLELSKGEILSVFMAF